VQRYPGNHDSKLSKRIPSHVSGRKRALGNG
jgi:hypothetical protein